MKPSEQFIQQLRSGKAISDEDAVLTNQWPEVDAGRKLIREEDVPKLLSLAAREQHPVKATAITLLQPFATRPEVSERLMQLWKEDDFETRYAVLWRLLDDPQLPAPIHREIFEFIRNNWSRFLNVAGGWYDEPERIIPAVRDRLNDPKFPDSKTWVYLCVLASSPDKDTARELVSGYATSNDPFLREVASFCLARS
jgi:hypothetical protein